MSTFGHLVRLISMLINALVIAAYSFPLASNSAAVAPRAVTNRLDGRLFLLGVKYEKIGTAAKAIDESIRTDFETYDFSYTRQRVGFEDYPLCLPVEHIQRRCTALVWPPGASILVPPMMSLRQCPH